MDVIITKQFEKDTEKELSPKMQLRLADIIEELQKVSKPSEINNIKKLKGFKSAYRIKMGDYRIGFILEDNLIKLSRIMNRKEIYRYFP
ncbi:type II toxin-antitoxin system RelE/ParE family toxin [Hanamia caeni]|jgi:mRNA interferase RelE/StbE|uniref:Type II toxin-antitoxin system RelE/ParE family toxin n=1 Tax=Hanamia caeni TaxID=2294116 RepID=A0A3M9NN00_9BACT|nr:type II toxin-antitoxin system RelE/ParE family toxin [Hanamia caeni]RNI39160.1 type II toxin-antitoxin system RelE/ParE family toxin [Hanamia caeni]